MFDCFDNKFDWHIDLGHYEMNNDELNDVILLICIVVGVAAFGFDSPRIGSVAVAVGIVAIFGGWKK